MRQRTKLTSTSGPQGPSAMPIVYVCFDEVLEKPGGDPSLLLTWAEEAGCTASSPQNETAMDIYIKNYFRLHFISRNTV